MNLIVTQSYDDFAECFSLWCEEQPDGADGVFKEISRHMESLIAVRSYSS
jgi:hypothetical protein